jgi:hypothetical protein
MRLVRACSAALVATFAMLVFAAPVQAEAPKTTASTDEIDIAIVGYTPNVGDITVRVQVTNKTGEDIGITVHIPEKQHQQRTLFKKGTTGQDVITEPIGVPCERSQYLIVEYKWGDVTKKPGVTSVGKKCQVAHKRDKESGGPNAQPNPSPSGELAKTGESGLWWAIHTGPVALLLGVALCLLGSPRRVSVSD